MAETEDNGEYVNQLVAETEDNGDDVNQPVAEIEDSGDDVNQPVVEIGGNGDDVDQPVIIISCPQRRSSIAQLDPPFLRCRLCLVSPRNVYSSS